MSCRKSNYSKIAFWEIHELQREVERSNQYGSVISGLISYTQLAHRIPICLTKEAMNIICKLQASDDITQLDST